MAQNWTLLNNPLSTNTITSFRIGLTWTDEGRFFFAGVTIAEWQWTYELVDERDYCDSGADNFSHLENRVFLKLRAGIHFVDGTTGQTLPRACAGQKPGYSTSSTPAVPSWAISSTSAGSSPVPN